MNTNTTSASTAALLAGLGLLVMAIIAPLANFGVLERLMIPGDPSATVANLAASSAWFRWAIVGFLVVIVLDVLVAWALHVLLEPVHKNLSLLAAWFRVAFAAGFTLALNPLMGALSLLATSGLETRQRDAQVMLSLTAFQSGWDLALVLFGCHLIVLGLLLTASGWVPRWLGVLVVIAGAGYLADSFAGILIPNNTVSISLFTFVGEFLLIFWLLAKAIREFRQPAPSAA